MSRAGYDDDDGGMLGNVQEMVMGAVALMALYCGWRFINSPTANLLGKTVNGAANTLQWSLSSPFALILTLVLIAAGMASFQLAKFQGRRWVKKMEASDDADAEAARQEKLEAAKKPKPKTEEASRARPLDEVRTDPPRPTSWLDSEFTSPLAKTSSKELKDAVDVRKFLTAHPEFAESTDLLDAYYDALNDTMEPLEDTNDSYRLDEDVLAKNNNDKRLERLRELYPKLGEGDKTVLAKTARLYMKASIGAIETTMKARPDIGTLQDLYDALPYPPTKARQVKKLLTYARKKGRMMDRLEALEVPGKGTLGRFSEFGKDEVDAAVQKVLKMAEPKVDETGATAAQLQKAKTLAEGDASGEAPEDAARASDGLAGDELRSV